MHDHDCAAATVDDDSFRFTDSRVAPTRLTAEQRRQYEDQGFLVVRGLFTKAELESYAEHFRKMCAGT